MAAAGLAFRAEFRQRWRAWLAVALLIAAAGGVTLSLVAAGRRTASAYPGFVVVVVAIAAGIPLGLAAGRLGWDLAASSFGVVDQIAIPVRELAAIVAAAMALAAAAAAGPAIFAAGLRPAGLLRAE